MAAIAPDELELVHVAFRASARLIEAVEAKARRRGIHSRSEAIRIALLEWTAPDAA